MALWRFGSRCWRSRRRPTAAAGASGTGSWLPRSRAVTSRADPADHLAGLASGPGTRRARDRHADRRRRAPGRREPRGRRGGRGHGGAHPSSWAAAAETRHRGHRARWHLRVNIVAVLGSRLSAGGARQCGQRRSPRPSPRRCGRQAGRRRPAPPRTRVAVLCPPSGPAEAFGGPRSRWGSRLARAVHRAVLDGTAGRGPDDHPRAGRGPVRQVRGGRARSPRACWRPSPTWRRWCPATIPTWPRGSRLIAPAARPDGGTIEAGAELPALLRSVPGPALRRRRSGRGWRRARA